MTRLHDPWREQPYRLTLADIAEIKASDEPQRELAFLYGVSERTIRKAKRLPPGSRFTAVGSRGEREEHQVREREPNA
jgi:hypothetical protein